MKQFANSRVYLVFLFSSCFKSSFSLLPIVLVNPFHKLYFLVHDVLRTRRSPRLLLFLFPGHVAFPHRHRCGPLVVVLAELGR
jgi:hypothetical protein